jgi:hypothetical protein
MLFIHDIVVSNFHQTKIGCQYSFFDFHISGEKEKYTDKFTSKHLHDCGLVVNPSFCFLGATPDGKVCSDSETGIIEIKCLYFARDMKIKEAILTPNFCLMKVGDNYVMNK